MSNQWIERWEEGRIGWHEEAGNKSLRKHWTASGKRVLVPLCGKSRDRIWLEQQGNEVVGVELSDIAVKSFFAENDMAYSVIDGELTAYVADDRRITIYCGDYFDLSRGPFSGLYDRGALVAISPDRREDYVRHTRSLLSDDAYTLIIAVEYDQSVADGPPFSIGAGSRAEMWPELERVDAYDDTEYCPPKFREAVLHELIDAVWRSPESTAFDGQS